MYIHINTTFYWKLKVFVCLTVSICSNVLFAKQKKMSIRIKKYILYSQPHNNKMVIKEALGICRKKNLEGTIESTI